MKATPFVQKVVLVDIPKLRKTGFECFDPFVIHRAKQPEGVARHQNQKLVSDILLIDELPNRPTRLKSLYQIYEYLSFAPNKTSIFYLFLLRTTATSRTSAATFLLILRKKESVNFKQYKQGYRQAYNTNNNFLKHIFILRF